MLTLAVIIISFLGLAFSGVLFFFLKKQDLKGQRIKEAGDLIRDLSFRYLRKEFFWIVGVVVLVFLFLIFLSWQIALLFVLGSLFSGLVACLSVRVSTGANVHVAEKTGSGIDSAFRTAFSFGSVLGLLIPALSILLIAILSLVFPDWEKIVAFGLGASLVALMVRVGGGIYAKSADMGSDWAGRSDGLLEDDPKNPALIAANVGDNVNDVAGMAANVFESLINILLFSLIFGIVLLPLFGSRVVVLPLLLSAWGLICSGLGLFLVKFFRIYKVCKIISLISVFLFLIGSLFFVLFLVKDLNLFWPVFFGSVSGLIICCAIAHFVSMQRRFAIKLSKMAVKGVVPALIEGILIGLMSLVFVSFISIFTIYLSHRFADAYGLVLSVVGMLSIIGIMVASEISGHVADNAGGIIGSAGLGEEAHGVSDWIDAMGNTRAAITKSLISVSTLILTLILLIFLVGSVGFPDLDLLSMRVIIGLVVGGVLPFVFCFFLLKKVSVSALKIADEIGVQLRENRADYEEIVGIASRVGIMPMVLIGLLSLIIPLVSVLWLGFGFLAGFFAGFMVIGFFLSVFSCVSGGAWDNAKKIIERKETGTLAHHSAVAGDTLGDPLKDLIGPMMNVLIKVMILAVLVFLPFL